MGLIAKKCKEENLRILKNFLNLLHNILHLQVQKEYTTISCVIPIVMELDLHLQEMQKVPELSRVATVFHAELKCRFGKLSDADHFDYEPLFIISTLLDPRYKLLLNSEQVHSAKEELLKYLKDAYEGNEWRL